MGGFVNLRKDLPDLILDIRYATTNNFTKQILYPSSDCFLREETAKKLKKALSFFSKDGYRIKIFDAYRPHAVQKRLWNVWPDARFVAPPEKGSKHSRGASLDMTLVDSSGQELKMPTAYDDFSERAYASYPDLPSEVLKNRSYLQQGMLQAGFVFYEYEWWHFDDKDWQRYEICDESFDTLLS